MSDEHKRKIGQANRRGRFINCAVCDVVFWVNPYQENQKYPRKCCSQNCFRIRQRETMSGEKNPSWKGGVTSRIKKGNIFISKSSFRFDVLERDNWTCVKCGIDDEEVLEVDHILEVSVGGKTEMENLQTLCANCHRRKTRRFRSQKTKPHGGK